MVNLSIIIITRNEEHYLPRLLDSIKSQNYKDYEIIVADFKSTDKTREIAKRAGCRIVPGGRYAAGRNSGARAAKGKLLLFLDADMVLTPDSLQKSLEEFSRRRLGVATFYAKPIDHKLIDNITFQFTNLYMAIVSKFQVYGWGACCLIEKSLFDSIGGYDEGMEISEDIEIMRRAAKQKRFGILRSVRIFISMRRFSQQGYIGESLKVIYISLHTLFHPKPKVKVKYQLDVNYKKPNEKSRK